MARRASIVFTVYISVFFICSQFAFGFLFCNDFNSHYPEAEATQEHQERSGLGMIKISGESYGNSGGRFTTFVECLSNYRYSTKYFAGGSELILSATLLDNHSTLEHMANGSWQLNLHKYGESNVVTKNGTFYSGIVIRQDNGDPMAFILHGVEAIDTACGGDPKLITIRVSCSALTPLYYIEENGDKIGSTTPLNDHKVYYLFTHRILCM